MKDVKMEKRHEDSEYLRMALAMCEFGVSYQQAELIWVVSKKVDILKGGFTLKDGEKLLKEWKESCEEYDKLARE